MIALLPVALPIVFVAPEPVPNEFVRLAPVAIVDAPVEVSVVKPPLLFVVAPIVVLLTDPPEMLKFEPVTELLPKELVPLVNVKPLLAVSIPSEVIAPLLPGEV